jgi:hypothetical protein
MFITENIKLFLFYLITKGTEKRTNIVRPHIFKILYIVHVNKNTTPDDVASTVLHTVF